MSGEGYLRIGELSRRIGLSPEILRAWERRYDLLEPQRSAGGFRLYSDADVERIGVMKEHLGRGLSPAEAARLARAGTPMPAQVVEDRAGLTADHVALRDSLDRFDEIGAQAALDQLFSTFTVETVLGDVVIPLLRDLGERWEQGEATIAQ